MEEFWHSEFMPSKFLSKVNLSKLIELNEVYNEVFIRESRDSCILCGMVSGRGILLNDKSYLCDVCYLEVSYISYPEMYEERYRNFIISTESRRLAWEAFRLKHEYISNESALVVLGWFSLLLVLVHPFMLVLTIILLAFGFSHNALNEDKANDWKRRKEEWEGIYPILREPVLKHFHDPMAILTARDRQILKIFNHWPGYPPFWKYLRALVISRDSHRCQVTGCPSRLELHVHHIQSVAKGGAHTPENLVSLCDFHHALEPEKGHERIWGNIKTRYFTLVREYEKNNMFNSGTHSVKSHLRRLQLINAEELDELRCTFGFCCPDCGDKRIEIILHNDRNTVEVKCPVCLTSAVIPQQLSEETGPYLAELLGVTKNEGRWKPRWDMLFERKTAIWGPQNNVAISSKRRLHQEKIQINKTAPSCPICQSPMRLKRPWKSSHTWKPFWGCTQYDVTGCRGSQKFLDLDT